MPRPDSPYAPLFSPMIVVAVDANHRVLRFFFVPGLQPITFRLRVSACLSAPRIALRTANTRARRHTIL